MFSTLECRRVDQLDDGPHPASGVVRRDEAIDRRPTGVSGVSKVGAEPDYRWAFGGHRARSPGRDRSSTTIEQYSQAGLRATRKQITGSFAPTSGASMSTKPAAAMASETSWWVRMSTKGALPSQRITVIMAP